MNDVSGVETVVGDANVEQVCWFNYRAADLVLLRRPERDRGQCSVGELLTGGVTVTPPQVSVELVDHLLHAVLSGGLHQVAGLPPCPDVVLVQVERMETLAVGQHRVKQTEPLALLDNWTLLLSLSF